MSLSSSEYQVYQVSNFQDLVSTPFYGTRNAICWARELEGDFSEIIEKVGLNGNMMELTPDELRALQLSEQGQLAREILLNDWQLLEAHGASPVLNLIKSYNRDDIYPFFPTDVYSFHVDRSPMPTDTFLCTYSGETSEIISNAQAVQKVLVPEIRHKLKQLYQGTEEGFESFLKEYFFDLHYQALPDASPIRLGRGHMCRLAVDYPESQVLPCLHRAPHEKMETRLLMIC